MKKLITLFAIAGMVLALAPAVHAQIVLMDPTTNDGSFESGIGGGFQPAPSASGAWTFTGGAAGPWDQVANASDGQVLYVANGGQSGTATSYNLLATGDSDHLYSVVNEGDVFTYSWDYKCNQAGETFSFGIDFGAGAVVLTNFTEPVTIPYITRPGTYTATAADAGSVLQVVITTEGGSYTDNALLSVVPFVPAEPAVQLDGGITGNVLENEPIGTVVGGIGTIVTESWAVTNLAFAGGTDDASFTISGTNLLTAEIFDKETKDSYSIDVKADDGAGTSTTNTFAITIDNVVEPFGGIYAGGSVAPGTTEVATLVSELGDNTSATYAIEAGYDAAKFTLTGAGDVLELANVGDAVLGAEYWVEVTATGDPSTSTRTLLIKVTVDNSGRGVIFIIE